MCLCYVFVPSTARRRLARKAKACLMLTDSYWSGVGVLVDCRRQALKVADLVSLVLLLLQLG